MRIETLNRVLAKLPNAQRQLEARTAKANLIASNSERVYIKAVNALLRCKKKPIEINPIYGHDIIGPHPVQTTYRETQPVPVETDSGTGEVWLRENVGSRPHYGIKVLSLSVLYKNPEGVDWQLYAITPTAVLGVDGSQIPLKEYPRLNKIVALFEKPELSTAA